MQLRSNALQSVKEAADELLKQAGDASDPAVQGKLQMFINVLSQYHLLHLYTL